MKHLTFFLFLLFSANGFSQPDTTIYVQACFSYTFPSGNYTSNLPGQFYDTLVAADGFDSIISIVLNPVYFINQETLLFEDGSLIAPPNLWTYKWIDCETGLTIPNENDNIFTPLSNGSYSVVLIDAAACTTDCFVLENLNVEEPAPFRVNLYPNPTKDIFTMQFSDNTSKKIVVYNALNEIILEKKVNQQELIVNLENQSSGVYLVKTTNDTGEFTTIKLVKQD